jgi:hypothetical protein
MKRCPQCRRDYYDDRFPDEGLSVIVLTNISGTNIDHWALDVAARYMRSLDRTKPVRDPDPALTAQHRSLLTASQNRNSQITR